MAESVKNAINENRVTPMIISLAPMVSPRYFFNIFFRLMYIENFF